MSKTEGTEAPLVSLLERQNPSGECSQVKSLMLMPLCVLLYARTIFPFHLSTMAAILYSAALKSDLPHAGQRCHRLAGTYPSSPKHQAWSCHR